MEKKLFIILFFTASIYRCVLHFLFLCGVVHLSLSVPRKYHLIQEGKSWNDAQAYCQINYDDLAAIDGNDNLIQLQGEIQRLQFSSSAWVGMFNDVMGWRWSLGNESVGLYMWATCWAQPNNGNEVCGGIDACGWLDATCDLLLPVVCFDARYSGTDRYISVSTSMTWFAAQSYCRQYHTDLASARNQSEQSIIQGKIPSFSWIGLHREFWKWTDGTNFSTIAWMPGKPNNALPNNNCGYINNYQASNALCSDIMPFFCHSILTGKQQLLEVKLVSSQNLYDQAVQEAILEKIKQNLLDHGIVGNVTVKWRKQPDGLLFHKERPS